MTKRASKGESQDKLKTALEAINKKYGEGSAMCLGKNTGANVEVLSTGSIAIDCALGAWGLPKGRICEIYGPEASGKTTFCLTVAAECQKEGGTVAFIDAEHALDPKYAANLGVDVSKLMFSQPQSGEEGIDICLEFVKAGVDLIIVDSVAALVPASELAGEIGDASVGSHARLMSKSMRMLRGEVSKNKCIVLFTNQIREAIGISFGSSERQPGGRALKFFASVRLDIRRIGQLKDPKDANRIDGNRTRVKVVKNKVGPPFTECEFDIRYGRGIDHIASIIDLAAQEKIVEKKGSWFSYNGELIGQGAAAAKDALKDNSELLKEVEGKVRQALTAEVGKTVGERKE